MLGEAYEDMSTYGCETTGAEKTGAVASVET